MSERRSKLEIMHDLLSSIQNKGGKIKPTHLLYKSNLSHALLKKYVELLTEKGLMKEDKVKKGRLYSLTDKGHTFLVEYERIRTFSEMFDL